MRKTVRELIRTMEVYLTIGTMGKKDAKREYYQVEEARRKHRTNCATRGKARVVTRRVRSAERVSRGE